MKVKKYQLPNSPLTVGIDINDALLKLTGYRWARRNELKESDPLLKTIKEGHNKWIVDSNGDLVPSNRVYELRDKLYANTMNDSLDRTVGVIKYPSKEDMSLMNDFRQALPEKRHRELITEYFGQHNHYFRKNALSVNDMSRRLVDIMKFSGYPKIVDDPANSAKLMENPYKQNFRYEPIIENGSVKMISIPYLRAFVRNAYDDSSTSPEIHLDTSTFNDIDSDNIYFYEDLTAELAHAFRGRSSVKKGRRNYSKSDTNKYYNPEFEEYRTHSITLPLLRDYIKGRFTSVNELDDHLKFAQQLLLNNNIDLLNKMIRDYYNPFWNRNNLKLSSIYVYRQHPKLLINKENNSINK